MLSAEEFEALVGLLEIAATLPEDLTLWNLDDPNNPVLI